MNDDTNPHVGHEASIYLKGVAVEAVKKLTLLFVRAFFAHRRKLGRYAKGQRKGERKNEEVKRM